MNEIVFCCFESCRLAAKGNRSSHPRHPNGLIPGGFNPGPTRGGNLTLATDSSECVLTCFLCCMRRWMPRVLPPLC